MAISNEKIIAGNIYIARFHGLYYRNDWKEKFPKGFCVKLKAWEVSQDFLTDRDLIQTSNRFRYHETWPQLMESWFCFQQTWKSVLYKQAIEETPYWKEFILGISKENKLMAWKRTCKRCVLFNKYPVG